MNHYFYLFVVKKEINVQPQGHWDSKVVEQQKVFKIYCTEIAFFEFYTNIVLLVNLYKTAFET